jgi:multidrug resistance efflux pump
MTARRWGASALVLLAASGLTLAGPAKEGEDRAAEAKALAAALAEAQKNNPDVRVAEARVRQARAELALARFEHSGKSAELDAEVAQARAVLALADLELARKQKLFREGATPRRAFDEAQTAAAQARANLAAAEARRRALGAAGKAGAHPAVGLAEAKVAVAEAELARTRAQVARGVVVARQAVVTGKAERDQALRDAVRMEVMRRRGPGTVSEADYEAAKAQYGRAQGKLVAAEAELAYLLGRAPGKVEEKKGP